MIGLHLASYAVFIADVAIAALPSLFLLYHERKRLYLEDLFAASVIFIAIIAMISGSGFDTALSQLVRAV